MPRLQSEILSHKRRRRRKKRRKRRKKKKRGKYREALPRKLK